ncbi:hypothetical protein ABE225_07190 [Priestia megaterium]
MEINWATAITIMGSFGAAYTAQIVSHRYSRKREEEKYQKEALQNLYSPLVFTIVDYIYGENYKSSVVYQEWFDEKEFKEDPLNPEHAFKEIMDTVSKNMKYAHSNLIMEYQEVKSSMTLFSEDQRERDSHLFLNQRMLLCAECLTEFIKISNKLGALSKAVEQKIQGPLFFTQFYLLLKGFDFIRLTDISINYISLIERVLENKKVFLKRIVVIRKEYEIIAETIPYCYGNREAFKNVYVKTYQFLEEFFQEISTLDPEAGGYLKSELAIALNLNDKMLG